MLGDLAGRFANGALWGLGAGVVLKLMRAEKSDEKASAGFRPVARAAMKGYLVASDRMREFLAEARETMEDLYAEAQAERRESRGAQQQPGPGRDGDQATSIPITSE